ALLDGR
ncbi:hypothetical protein VCHC69A1_3231B, partial [Vibrio cholerae HC-69A1]